MNVLSLFITVKTMSFQTEEYQKGAIINNITDAGNVAWKLNYSLTRGDTFGREESTLAELASPLPILSMDRRVHFIYSMDRRLNFPGL